MPASQIANHYYHDRGTGAKAIFRGIGRPRIFPDPGGIFRIGGRVDIGYLLSKDNDYTNTRALEAAWSNAVADPQKRLEQMNKGLRDKGCRLTRQRLAMLRIIAKSAGHPAAEQIYAQIKVDFPTTSLAAIYKT